jgi:hypothetical protein
MKIPWPAWVVLGDNDSAPRPTCSPAPALVISPRSPLRGQLDAIDGAPAGSIGWIGDAPVFVLDDGDTAESTPPEQRASPRARTVSPEQLAQELAQAKTQAIAALTAEVERNIEARYTPSQQRLLTAVYTRSIGKTQANKRAKVEALVDWVEAQTLHLYDLAAQVQAAQTVADVEAVAFDASRFPAPQHSARDVLTTEG